MKKRVLSMVMMVLLLGLLLTGVTLADDTGAASAAAEEAWTTVSDASGLLDAIRDAASSTEAAPARIKLLNDISFDAAGSSINGDLEIYSGYIILDLNGCSITGSGAYSVIYIAGGTLQLQDTALTTQYLEDMDQQSLPDELFDADGTFQAAVLKNENSAGHTTWTTYYCSVKTDSNGDPVLDSEGNVQLIYCSYTSGAVTGGGLTASVSFGGGGVCVCENAAFVLDNGTICNNTAEYAGGVANYGTMTFEDGSISGNWTQQIESTMWGNGGGINNLGVFCMNGGLVCGNTAKGFGNSDGTCALGGGIFVHHDSTVASITGGVISGNQATYGGGLYLRSNTTTTAYISNVFIVCNEVTPALTSGSHDKAMGAGIYINPEDDSVKFLIENCVIAGNISTRYGGGVSLESGSLRISDSIINNNQAAQGGGLRICSNAEITGCLIANNSASSMDDFDGELLGGGILLYTDGKLSVSGSTISGNTAEYGGGVLSFGVVTISGTTISDNRATNRGGGVYVASSGSITMQDGSSVTGNKASMCGDGIYSSSGTLTVTN